MSTNYDSTNMNFEKATSTLETEENFVKWLDDIKKPIQSWRAILKTSNTQNTVDDCVV